MGPRILDDPNDGRHHLDQLAESRAIEEESASGPPCFGPRIQNEPFPDNFTLPRDTPKYSPDVKAEDWLTDYAIAVGSLRSAYAARTGLGLAEQPVAQQHKLLD